MQASRARRWVRGTVSCALAGLAAACAFPTDAPIFEQHWNVPGESTTIGVGEMLPSTVSVDNGAFAVAIDAPAPVTRTLYQDCAACAASDGQTIAKPAFTAVATSTTSLPTDVAGALLSASAVSVTIRNEYAFDPLRPAAGVTGTLTLRVTNGATVLGTTTVTGATSALAPDGTLTVDVPITGAVSRANPITVQVELESPVGDPATMTAAQRILVSPVVAGVRASSAAVEITDQVVSTTSEVDLSDIDEAITQRLDSAAIRLTLTNPFEVAGTLTATLEAPGQAPLARTIELGANATGSTQFLRYTASEIRTFFGHTVTLRVSGPVGAAAPVAVSPTEAVSVASRLDLFVALGR
jgi:hypothetical protein